MSKIYQPKIYVKFEEFKILIEDVDVNDDELDVEVDDKVSQWFGKVYNLEIEIPKYKIVEEKRFVEEE